MEPGEGPGGPAQRAVAAERLRRRAGARVRAVRGGAVADEVRRRGGTELFTTWEPGPTGPGEFYRRLGFRETGETSGGQTVGVLEVGAANGT